MDSTLWSNREAFEHWLRARMFSERAVEWLLLVYQAANGSPAAGLRAKHAAGAYWFHGNLRIQAAALGCAERTIQRLLEDELLEIVEKRWTMPESVGERRRVLVYRVSLGAIEARPACDRRDPIDCAIMDERNGRTEARTEAERERQPTDGRNAGHVAKGTEARTEASHEIQREARNSTSATPQKVERGARARMGGRAKGRGGADCGATTPAGATRPPAGGVVSRVASGVVSRVASGVVSHDLAHRNLKPPGQEVLSPGGTQESRIRLRDLTDEKLLEIVRNEDGATIAAVLRDGIAAFGWPASDDHRVCVFAMFHYAAMCLRPRKSRLAWLYSALKARDFRAIAAGESAQWADDVIRRMERPAGAVPATLLDFGHVAADALEAGASLRELPY